MRLFLRSLLLTPVLLFTLSASSPVPRPSAQAGPLQVDRAKAEREPRSESPAKFFIEDLPPTPNLPRSTIRPASVPALQPTTEVPAFPAWTALGPFPIPNGQTQNRTDPVSGRVTAIAIDPADPNIAYVGAAQGGLYRTLNRGTTWTQLMDNAFS